MGRIAISETQFAFGYLHSYLNINKGKKFILPSLQEEGGRGKFKFSGADLVIENNYLIQFKKPFYFTTDGIKEFWNYSRPTDIWAPYFRLHIKNSSPTNQLNNLVKATKRGFRADYISPMFTTDSQFFSLLSSNSRHVSSYAHIDIAQFDSWLKYIGRTDDHTIIYTTDSINKGFCYCFSEPKRLKATSLYFLADNNTYQPEPIPAREALSSIKYSFWNFEDTDQNVEQQDNYELYLQLRDFQRRLLIERGIIWLFSIRI